MIYRTQKGTEIDIECTMVYVNRPDLALRTLASIPEGIPVHFVEELEVTKCPSLRSEVQKRINLQFYEKDQQGCATDWNFCLRQCTSKYVLLISTDIEMLNNVVDRSIDAFMKFVAENSEKKIVAVPYHCRWMKAWLINRELFNNVGGFCEEYWIGGEDDDFIIQGCQKDYHFGVFNTGTRHVNDMIHMDGGKHTRGIRKAGVSVNSNAVLWRRWAIKDKDTGKAWFEDTIRGRFLPIFLEN